MASKPEKRVASSVFITLAPPQRNLAVAEEVKPAACEARPGRPREAPATVKAPGAGSAGRPSLWTPPARAAAAVPAVPPQLANGGKKRGTGHEAGSEAARRWGGRDRLRAHSCVRSFMSTCYVPGRLKPTCLGLNPGSSAWLCDVGKHAPSLFLCFLIYKTGVMIVPSSVD